MTKIRVLCVVLASIVRVGCSSRKARAVLFSQLRDVLPVDDLCVEDILAVPDSNLLTKGEIVVSHLVRQEF